MAVSAGKGDKILSIFSQKNRKLDLFGFGENVVKML
jgi:hypothetical protein